MSEVECSRAGRSVAQGQYGSLAFCCGRAQVNYAMNGVNTGVNGYDGGILARCAFYISADVVVTLLQVDFLP